MPSHRLEIRLSSLQQLFNSLDPAPFHEKDLDRDAEEYIVGWANEFPPESALQLVIRLPQDEVELAESHDVSRAVHNYFAYRARAAWRRMRSQLREGRTALLIGALFLMVCMLLRQLVAIAVLDPMLQRALQEGLLIMGWVAMWRPLQIFLYDWWPIRRHARLCEKLAKMPVKALPDSEARHGAGGPAPGAARGESPTHLTAVKS